MFRASILKKLPSNKFPLRNHLQYDFHVSRLLVKRNHFQDIKQSLAFQVVDEMRNLRFLPGDLIHLCLKLRKRARRNCFFQIDQERAKQTRAVNHKQILPVLRDLESDQDTILQRDVSYPATAGPR